KKHEIKVRCVTEFLAAKLAVADDRELRRRKLGLAVHLRPAMLERRRKYDVRQRRQVIGEPFDGEPAVQILRQQPKRLRMLKMPQHVHLPLGIARVGAKLKVELAPPRIPI